MKEAIQYHIEALKDALNFLTKKRYLVYFIPGLIITLLYYIFIFRFLSFENFFLIETSSMLLGWLFDAINWIVSIVFSFGHFIVKQFYIFTTLTLLSPFFTAMSAKIDSEITGTKFDFTFKDFLKDIFRMLLVVTIAMSLEIFFIIIFWFLSFIPLIGLLSPVVYFIISAFFFGLSFYDYPLERNKISVGKTIKFAFNNPLITTLTGSVFLLIYAIPVIGTPISPVVAIMVASLVYIKMHAQKINHE